MDGKGENMEEKEKPEWKLRESKFYKENYGTLLTFAAMLEISYLHKVFFFIEAAVHLPVATYTVYLLFEKEFSGAMETAFLTVFYFLCVCASFNFKKELLVEIIRMLDQKLFDYGNTIDPETATLIEEEQKRIQKRKYFRTKLMVYALNGAVITLIVVKPIFEIFFIQQKDQDLFEGNVNRLLPMKVWYFLDVRNIGVQIHMWITLYYVIIQVLYMAAVRRAQFIGEGKVDKSNLDECFKRCIIHHQNIIRCFKLFQEYFYWIIWLVLTICTYQICLSGLLLTLESLDGMEIGIGLRLTAFTFLVGQVLYLFFFCLYGEEVEGMSSEIYYAAYEMDWLDYAIEMKQNLQILRIRAFHPLKFSCGGLFFANFDTFSNVMNGAYSYFSLLKASLNKKE